VARRLEQGALWLGREIGYGRIGYGWNGYGRIGYGRNGPDAPFNHISRRLI
jgi:hypothetical protein